jgi:hypothetical protein
MMQTHCSPTKGDVCIMWTEYTNKFQIYGKAKTKWFIISFVTSVACAVGPSVTTSSTDFFLPQPVFFEFI